MKTRKPHDSDSLPLETERAIAWEQGPHGYRVTWWSQKDTADALGISTRWLQELEPRGMPARGRRGSKEYCWPDVLMWHVAYRRREGSRLPVRFLSMDVARAEYQLENAREAERARVAG